MNDGQRAPVVDVLVMHHSTGPEFYNSSDLEIQDWFSEVGKNRGYNGGAINSNHEHPGRPGQQTYAMAHYALANSDRGWRLVELVKRPFLNTCWHSGNWNINTRSIGVETCGNYLNKTLPEAALRTVADMWRPQDIALGGQTTVHSHSEFYPTQCCGLIAGQLGRLVEILNNEQGDKDLEKVNLEKTRVDYSGLSSSDTNLIKNAVEGNRGNPDVQGIPDLPFLVRYYKQVRQENTAYSGQIASQTAEIARLNSLLQNQTGGGLTAEQAGQIAETNSLVGKMYRAFKRLFIGVE